MASRPDGWDVSANEPSAEFCAAEGFFVCGRTFFRFCAPAPGEREIETTKRG